MKAFSEPYLAAKVVNPVGDVLPYNADAQSYLAADVPVVQFFDPVADKIAFNAAHSEQFNFQPHFVEHFALFRFVYLQPEKEG